MEAVFRKVQLKTVEQDGQFIREEDDKGKLRRVPSGESAGRVDDGSVV